MMSDSGLISNLTQGVYIIAGALFILGLIRLRSPATARSGNMLSAVGMLLAVVFTLVNADIVEPEWMIIGLGGRGCGRRVHGSDRTDDRHASDGGGLQRIRRRRLRIGCCCRVAETQCCPAN